MTSAFWYFGPGCTVSHDAKVIGARTVSAKTWLARDGFQHIVSSISNRYRNSL